VIRLEKVGRESRMTVLDPDKVSDLLIIYRRTFFDKLVDEFVARYVEHGPAVSESEADAEKPEPPPP
jgi:hypothetical protein